MFMSHTLVNSLQHLKMSVHVLFSEHVDFLQGKFNFNVTKIIKIS